MASTALVRFISRREKNFLFNPDLHFNLTFSISQLIPHMRADAASYPIY